MTKKKIRAEEGGLPAVQEKPKRERQLTDWGVEEEVEYIDGLGGHSEYLVLAWMTPAERLESYIAVHMKSPHFHHQYGCQYAWGKLRGLYNAGI